MVFEICMANDERQFVSWNYIPVITVTIFVNAKDHQWMPQIFVTEKSILFQVMNWCRQAISFYLRQCWARSRAMTDSQQSMTWSAWYRLCGKPLSKQFATEISNIFLRHRFKEVKIKSFSRDVCVFTWFSTSPFSKGTIDIHDGPMWLLWFNYVWGL